jgi:plasmid stability protein
MGNFTIRKIDEELMVQLREQAARNNRSPAEEAREIIIQALNEPEVHPLSPMPASKRLSTKPRKR